MALTPSDLRRRKMNLLMAMSYAAFASSKASAWSPTLLFAAGEQGAWYDPSDFNTMFQDSAGTTPVTAVEQPVGLLLDKSKGLALGSDLTLTAWSSFSIGTGTATVAGETVTLVGTDGSNRGRASRTLSVTADKWYRVNYTLAVTSGGIALQADSSQGAGGWAQINPVAGTGNFYFKAGTTTATAFISAFTASGGGNVTLTINSVKELPGNHASQSTSASRPVLSARVNLLTYSEQFDNAAWAKVGGSISANATTAPDGTTTADLFTEDAANSDHYVALTYAGTSGVSYTWSIYVKPNGRTWIVHNAFDTVRKAVWFNCTGSGSVGTQDAGVTAASISAVGNGWYRISSTRTTSAANFSPAVFPATADGSFPPYAGNGTSGFYLWGADLRVTNDGVGLPAYQRINAATDYDTSGFPLYLKFDGTDDSLSTASIDFSATDKMSVFAGHRFVSGTGSQFMCELGTSAFISSGFAFGQGTAAASSGLGFLMNAGSGIGAQTADKSVPYTSVSSLLLNSAQSGISNEGILRSNTTSQTYTVSTGTDSGTANFPNKNLYIGNRSGSSVWFNGRLYSLIVRGAQSTDAQIASTEAWVNNVTKGY